MSDKLCPLKIELTNDRYYCSGESCAWWVIVNDFQFGNSVRKVGRCAITQLAYEINCNVKEHSHE
jgi:hypothetical protein